MFGIGWGELALIFIIILVLFGPQKAQGIFRAFGKGLQEFKGAMSSLNMNQPPNPADFQKKTTEGEKPAEDAGKEAENKAEPQKEPTEQAKKQDIGKSDE